MKFPLIHCSGQLFKQYICNLWVFTDQSHLQWIEDYQHELHAALYNGLKDVMQHGKGNVNMNDIGNYIILPSSYISGP
jgi:helitron helicase-like protein